MKQEDHLKKAEEVQREIYKNMSAGKKLREAERLFHSAKALKAAHYRKVHPELTEEEIQIKVKEWMLYAKT